MSLATILEKIRIESRNTSEKGRSFEKLTKGFFQTDPRYAEDIEKIWLWMEFPFRDQFGGIDTGIDVVAKAEDGYWAIQCKCYKEDYVFSQEDADSFIAASAKKFKTEEGKTTTFARRFWVSSNREFGLGFERKIENQDPPIIKLSLNELENAAVDWDKLWEGIHGKKARLAPKELRRHQKEALELTRKYFQKKDRGKLIMACGTGKTFTALRIAEDQVRGKEDGGLILCLVPSIALVSQMLREWTADAVEHINAICVCSDPKVVDSASDDAYGRVADLPLPASTDPEDVAKQIRRYSKKPGPTVIFSTYHSIRVISDAQKLLGNKGLFDLIICDEAHRTTGVTLAKDVAEGLESAFVKVHDDKFLHAKKRLYMTATPRLYTENAKAKAEEAEAVLCSMDDAKLYGEEIYRLGFGAAVEEGLLSDYKVLVLVLSETEMKKHLQNALSDKELEETLMPGLLQKAFVQEEQKNPLVYVGKLIGCINALSKKKLVNGELISSSDPAPMRRAVAFCQTINVSRKTAEIFGEVQKGYFKNRNNGDDQNSLTGIETDHVDGTMTASVRDRKLNWLKAENDPELTSCRILTNVRCLSEGVDVPALDAVLFLAPRSSHIDVVQSVGRVMRRAEGKKYGYIILPVVVPPGTNTEEILNENERFKTVWSVLNALRAHDDRFDATINKIKLISRKDALPIHIVTPEPDTDDPNPDIVVNTTIQPELNLIFSELSDKIYVKMVEKVGTRDYFEKWAREVGKIAARHEARIGELIAAGGKHKKAFDEFLAELRQNINPEIDEKNVIEMLAQHIVSRPVFDALFAGSAFTKNNAISKSMTKMLAQLEDEEQEDERKLLEQFQKSVQRTVGGYNDFGSKQTVIVELYEKFFKTAYPKVVEKLGIVYTPTEIVDFLIHSVESVLKEDFNSSLADKNVHILDPFTGTGTFITRLLLSGLIPKEKLLEKYKKEIHANEIVLLAYYIACVNIENAFAEVSGSEIYEDFPGACLTDTFQLGEPGNEEMLFRMFPENSERVRAQKKTPIRVILGNPPYSIGQKSENDNAQNQHYEKLENKIRETYAARTSAQLSMSLYDSYVKAFRWASDRLDENGGVIAFVTNGGWLDGVAFDGFRKCIEEEFSKVYVFNLRGNLRAQGADAKKKEGEGVFPIKTPVVLTVLVKNKKHEGKKAKIYYRDIGDYLKKKAKLEIISKAHNVDFHDGGKWTTLKPNKHGDWLNLRNEKFDDLIPLAPEENFNSSTKSIFVVKPNGLKTNRDTWTYNFSRKQLCENMKRSIDFYNSEMERFSAARRKNRNAKVKDIIDLDPKKFSWDVKSEQNMKSGERYKFSPDAVRVATYRAFQKQNLYFSRDLNARVSQIPKIFPKSDSENLVICVRGKGGGGEFSCLITNVIPDLNMQLAGAHCFPLYYYDEEQEDDLFNNGDRHDGISDFALEEAQKLYGKGVTKEDIFYYVYGLLHSEDYREEFAANLRIDFPKVPFVKKADDFRAFAKAGRALAKLHLNYETLQLPKNILVTSSDGSMNYRVSKMRFDKDLKERDRPGRILYNDTISVGPIPPEAYDYVVNGKSAIGWIMDRYQFTTDKDSGIVNDPNLWCTEHNDPEYIVNLLRRVIYLSCETVKIVKSLPKIDFSEY